MLMEIIWLLTTISEHDANESESLAQRKSSFSYATTILNTRNYRLALRKKSKRAMSQVRKMIMLK